MVRLLSLLILGMCAQPASNIDRLPTARKMEMIELGRVDPGSQVTFSEPELNVYLAERIREAVPEGMKNPRVQIGDGNLTANARVDLMRMKRAQGGEEPNWLMRQVLEGERELQVIGRLTSEAGRGRVEIERVEIGGVAMKGRMLEFLIDHFVAPRYPQAKVGESFDLGYNMEKIELKPGKALVTMAPKRQPWRRAAAAQELAAPRTPPAQASPRERAR